MPNCTVFKKIETMCVYGYKRNGNVLYFLKHGKQNMKSDKYIVLHVYTLWKCTQCVNSSNVKDHNIFADTHILLCVEECR